MVYNRGKYYVGSGRDRSVIDFKEADRIPDGEFNKIIWYAVKGLDAEYPGTRRAAFLKVIEDED